MPIRFEAAIRLTIISLAISSLGGCAILSQDRDTVYVRASGTTHWNLNADNMTREALEVQAGKHWQFAVMSENAYHGHANFPIGQLQAPRLADCKELSADARQTILHRKNPRPDLSQLTLHTRTSMTEAAGWVEWPPATDLISRQTWCKSVEHGLAYRIYEREQDGVVEIAIAFRGTVWDYWPNVKSNLRWFIHWPWTGEDANMVVQNRLTADMARAIVQRHPERVRVPGALRMYSTGHSLGGALAQQFAYAFPPAGYPVKDYPGLKLEQVVVFNPSPVNGWVSVPAKLREANAGGVPVSRVFQHGEALAYVRLLLGYVVPLNDGTCGSGTCLGPKIEEVRYNRLFTEDGKPAVGGWKRLGSPAASHAMRDLAAGLASVAGKIADNYYSDPSSTVTTTALP
ncbi:hypothetical protein F2P45_00630 [Massilia sp. CCM 8733]|uniref:Fungal lipase-like domain-containing protein n=1 Tax=Massilia mucilaginosa TaxID=2609282 RepID=A0ABX0NL65_9BURK|nr:lipase family protein [Massilia mucilaginosa]NHZ87544.1 hypothetical protein [Massilia mucilaginosa]